MPISLGRADKRPQYCLAVLLDLRRRNAVHRTQLPFGLAHAGLHLILVLPVAVSLVSDQPQGGYPAIGDDLAAHLAGLLAAHQHADRTAAQGATADAAEQPAQAGIETGIATPIPPALVL